MLSVPSWLLLVPPASPPAGDPGPLISRSSDETQLKTVLWPFDQPVNQLHSAKKQYQKGSTSQLSDQSIIWPESNTCSELKPVWWLSDQGTISKKQYQKVWNVFLSQYSLIEGIGAVSGMLTSSVSSSHAFLWLCTVYNCTLLSHCTLYRYIHRYYRQRYMDGHDDTRMMVKVVWMRLGDMICWWYMMIIRGWYCVLTM